jgi:hypothetical protein
LDFLDELQSAAHDGHWVNYVLLDDVMVNEN